MSYIVKALRKLEQERRRVTVTEMSLFRGLSERWRSETPVWRYLLLFSLVVNTGMAVWLLIVFFPGVNAREREKLNAQITEPSPQTKKETVARPYQNIITPDAPMRITLEAKPSQRGKTQAIGKIQATGHDISPLSRKQSLEGNDLHTRRSIEHVPHKVLSADEMEMYETGSYTSPNVLTWKDDKGNIHYSGTAGKD